MSSDAVKGQIHPHQEAAKHVLHAKEDSKQDCHGSNSILLCQVPYELLNHQQSKSATFH